jgi:hypothetical protein
MIVNDVTKTINDFNNLLKYELVNDIEYYPINDLLCINVVRNHLINNKPKAYFNDLIANQLINNGLQINYKNQYVNIAGYYDDDNYDDFKEQMNNIEVVFHGVEMNLLILVCGEEFIQNAITCKCGSFICGSNLKQAVKTHNKSKKHIKFLVNQINK